MSRTVLVMAQRNDFAYYWEHFMIFETWNPDIQESWIPLDLASVCWLQCIGYFSTQFLSLNLIFNAKFQNSITPRIFLELFGILELLLKWTILFLPSSTYRVIFPLNFWPETWLSIWNSKIPSFLESFKNHMELL